MILKMAYRNVFRNKKRNLLTLSLMIVGIALAIFYDGLIKGFSYETFEIYKKTDLGLYKIYAKNYYKNRNEDEKIDYLFDEKEILNMSTFNNYSVRLNFQGTLSNGEFSLPINYYGVNSKNENIVFDRDKDMVQGKFIENKNSLIIGWGIAKDLNLKIGDNVTIITRTSKKSINAYDMNITGIIKTKNTILNKNTVFLDLDFAKEYLLTDKINEIVTMEKLNKKTINELNNYDVISLEEELKDMIDLMKYKAKAANNSIILILAMAGVGIANIMLMSMLERGKEIGIMLANGMESSDIKKLFLLESFILGVIGSLLGFILGLILVLYASKYGIPLPKELYKNIDLNIIMPEKMTAIIDIITYIKFTLFGIFIATISGFYAANKSSKIEPLDVLKE